MRIVTLNLQHGGGARVPRIVQHLLSHSADLLVLTEYRERARGAELRRLLSKEWPHQIASPTGPRENGLLMACRSPMTATERLEDCPGGPTRWCEVFVEGVRIAGAYLPADAKSLVPFWNRLLEHARSRVHDAWLVVGDFNTGLGGVDSSGPYRFSGQRHMSELLALGYVDAWRAANPEGREYSWFSNLGNGFRIDHAVLSPALASRVSSVSFDHTIREARVTDHSLFSIELSDVLPVR